MKKFFSNLLFATILTVAMAGRTVAQSNLESESDMVFLMNEEPYCALHFDFMDLAQIVAQSDTIVDDEDMRFMDYPYFATDGENELAMLFLAPDDDDINVIVIQEDEEGNPVFFRMLTSVGWMEYYEDEDDGSYPGALGDFMAMVYAIRHMDEVSR